MTSRAVATVSAAGKQLHFVTVLDTDLVARGGNLDYLTRVIVAIEAIANRLAYSVLVRVRHVVKIRAIGLKVNRRAHFLLR